MTATTGDHSIFFKRVGNRLVDLSGFYVGNILRVGIDAFLTRSLASTRTFFDTKLPSHPPLTFTGLSINSTSHGYYATQQKDIKNLRLMTPKSQFRSFAQLEWVTNARLDICAAVAFASQVTDKTFSSSDIT